ncbi:hypothetical protein JK154_01415 [Citrobacter sp. JGM124]|nr:hypothetical protein [Citrobacter sp. JGM124]
MAFFTLASVSDMAPMPVGKNATELPLSAKGYGFEGFWVEEGERKRKGKSLPESKKADVFKRLLSLIWLL